MATLKDIAKHVGISIPAASMALRGHSSIGEKTRQRVWEAKEELGYKIRKKSTGNIAFVLIDRDFSSFYADAFQIIGKMALQADLRPLYLTLESASLLKGNLPNILKKKEVDGIIVSGELGETLYRRLKKLGIPLVALGNYRLGGEPWAACETDIASGVHLLLERFAELGHRRIELLAGSSGKLHYGQQARQGFHNGLLDFPEIEGRILALDEIPANERKEAIRNRLAAPDRPTAVIIENHPVLSVYDLSAALDLRIPEDISIAGLGKTVSEFRPPVARAEGDEEAMSRAAFEKLLKLLENPKTPLSREIFGMRLVTGGSIGPAPGENRKRSGKR